MVTLSEVLLTHVHAFSYSLILVLASYIQRYSMHVGIRSTSLATRRADCINVKDCDW